MTPETTVRRAADLIEKLAIPVAATGRWVAETDEHDEDEWVIASEPPIVDTPHGGVMFGGQWTVAREVPENIAQWASALGPQIADPLVAWLRSAADDLADVAAQNARTDERAARTGGDGHTYVLCGPMVSGAVAFATALLDGAS